jgi:predicted porin
MPVWFNTSNFPKTEVGSGKFRAPVQTLENLEMKKTLVALAALAATSAFAQSSVTAYGIIDAGYSASHRINTAAASTEEHARGITGGNQSSSRIGFKGMEDIGGGTAADFTAEFGVNPAKSNFSGSTNDVNDTAFDNRQTFVGLTGNLGRVTIGRQYTATHGTIANTDAGMGNNLIGGTTYTGGNSTTDYKTSPSYGNSAYIVRSSEAIAYSAPAYMGFTATVGAALNKKRTDKAAGSTFADAADARSLSLKYEQGPLFASVSRVVAEADVVIKGAATASSLSFGGQGMVLGAAAVGTDYRIQAKQTQDAFGATYQLPAVKLFGNYLKTTTVGTRDTADWNAVERTAWELGARAPIAGNFTGFAKYGKGKTNLPTAVDITAASATTKYDFSAYQAGVDYNMSKRTNVYGILGHTKFDAATAAAAGSATQYAVGIRHQF